MSKDSHLLAAILLAALLLLSACGPGSTTNSALPAVQVSIPLEGTEWVLVSLRSDQPVAGSSPTLAFYPDNYMEGTAGCNSYGAGYAADGQGFQLGEIHKTDFDCQTPPGVMAQDRAFFEAIPQITAYQASEDHLVFNDAAGEAILVYARQRPPPLDPRLKDTGWLLISLLGDSLLEGSRITLNLGAERFDGYAGCNNYGGEYEAADRGVLLTSEIFSTAMDCPPPAGIEGIMEQETAYLQALDRAATYRLADGRLEIADASGEIILVFNRKAEFATHPDALLGTAWRLVSIDGDSLGGDAGFTLVFYSDTVLGGRAGCRDYLAAYEAAGDDLNLLLEAMFDAGCRVEDADLEQEAQFLGIMAPKADLRLAEGQLEIHGERGGVLVFEPLPQEANLELAGPTWSLLAFVGPNPYVEEPDPWPVPTGLLLGTTIDLAFEGGEAGGSAGCNRYEAIHSRDDPSLNFDGITATEMACLDPQGLMEQEVHYLDLLAAVSSYQIFGDRLWLETDDGQALVFFASAP